MKEKWKMKMLVGGVSAAAAIIAAVTVMAVAGGASPPPPSGIPALSDPTAPSMPIDLGVGEQVLLVVADGSWQTKAEADAANAAFGFGEMQGFYAVPNGQFPEIGTGLGPWLLVSAFRTQEGADGFAEIATSAGATVTVTGRVTSGAGEYAGLGQEASADGSGPLKQPITASMPAPVGGTP